MVNLNFKIVGSKNDPILYKSADVSRFPAILVTERNYFRDAFDKLKGGFIVQVTNGKIGVYYSNCGLKDGLFMELNDSSIIKSEFKTLTATSFKFPGNRSIYGTAQFTGIGGRCDD